MPTMYEFESMRRNINDQFSNLFEIVESSVGAEELHNLEKSVFENLQGLGLSLLEYFVSKSGTGYEPGQRLSAIDGKTLAYKGIVDSPYFSIFGEIRIQRARYKGDAGKYYYPLDEKLNLPEKKYSYLLQKWLQAGAVVTNFNESVKLLNEIFDHSFFSSMPQRIGLKVSAQVKDFYKQQTPPDQQTEGSHIGIGADGKGVYLTKSERDNKEQNQASKMRLGKGEKRGTKKEAVVTGDFSFNPATRTPQEVVEALFKERSEADVSHNHPACEKPRYPKNKHLRATLKGKDAAMKSLMERILKRDPDGEKPIVALVDGDPNLEKSVRKALKKHRLNHRLDSVVLDIIHVTEYIWDVGTALHGERSSVRPKWVREKLLHILNGRVGYVTGGFKQTLTKKEATRQQKRALTKAITYFENHKHMMNYKTYLEKGYPIATGVIESACGSLVKDRMEQSGMRWTIKGATAILEQRAVKLNGDWDTFWDYYMMNQRKTLYTNDYKIAA